MQRRQAEPFGEAAVAVVDLAGEHAVAPPLGELQDGVEEDLAVGGKRPAALDDDVLLQPVLRLHDVVRRDPFGVVALRHLRGEPEQRERPPRVAVLQGGVGGAALDDAGVDDVVVERLLRAVAQDVLELEGVVRLEDDLLLVQAAADPRVQLVGELEVVRDPDQAQAGALELGVQLAERVEDVVAAPRDQAVDLVQDQDGRAVARLHQAAHRRLHAVERPAGRDPLGVRAGEAVADRLQ